MSSNEYEGATMPPGPDPALRRLDRFVGTWEVSGRTLGAEEDNVSGRLSFEWLPGVPIPYEYDVQGDRVTIRTELAGGATFTGTWADDGESMWGGWRPDEGKEGPGNVAYDVSGKRAG